MKPYILTIKEECGAYIYSVYAESFRDAYEKIKKDDDLCLASHRNLCIHENDAIFEADTYCYPVTCTITELKEHDGIICLGGYAE